jgi:DNA-binding CsgD family transcriptional regulator
MAKVDSDTTCWLGVPPYCLEAVLGLTATTACERYGRLSRRERQVAAMIAVGAPSHQIAAELGISRKSINIYRTNIKIKLAAATLAHIGNVVNLVQLVGMLGGGDDMPLAHAQSRLRAAHLPTRGNRPANPRIHGAKARSVPRTARFAADASDAG